MQLAELDYLFRSTAAATAFAETMSDCRYRAQTHEIDAAEHDPEKACPF